MSTDTKPSAKTYRYKFSQEFLVNLKDFARVHKFDDSQVFKDSWEEWCKTNNSVVEKESKRLKTEGYTGDVLTEKNIDILFSQLLQAGYKIEYEMTKLVKDKKLVCFISKN